MLKLMHLAILGTIVSGLSLPFAEGALAQVGDSPCYMRNRSGKVSDLSHLCGPEPAQGRVRPRSTKVADCKKFLQVILPASKEISLTAQALQSRKGAQLAGSLVDNLVEVYSNLTVDLAALETKDTTLTALKSDYVGHLSKGTTLLQRLTNAAKSNNVKAAKQLLPSLEKASAQAVRVGEKIDRYCQFK